jgi:hypothetical protein
MTVYFKYNCSLREATKLCRFYFVVHYLLSESGLDTVITPNNLVGKNLTLKCCHNILGRIRNL